MKQRTNVLHYLGTEEMLHEIVNEYVKLFLLEDQFLGVPKPLKPKPCFMLLKL